MPMLIKMLNMIKMLIMLMMFTSMAITFLSIILTLFSNSMFVHSGRHLVHFTYIFQNHSFYNHYFRQTYQNHHHNHYWHILSPSVCLFFCSSSISLLIRSISASVSAPSLPPCNNIVTMNLEKNIWQGSEEKGKGKRAPWESPWLAALAGPGSFGFGLLRVAMVAIHKREALQPAENFFLPIF